MIEGTDRFLICLGARQKKTGLGYVVSSKEVVRVQTRCEKLRAQLLVGVAVLRFNQQRSHNRETSVVSRPMLKRSGCVVSRLLPLAETRFHLRSHLEQLCGRRFLEERRSQ